MLLVPGQFKVDVFTEIERLMDEPYELVVLEGTLKELERIAKEAGADDRRAAKLAQLLVDHQRKGASAAAKAGRCKGLKIIDGSAHGYVDDAIVAIAEDDALVATNDGELKRRLLERGGRVIFLKQKQYLAMSA